MSIFSETKKKLHKNVTDIGFKLKGRTYYRLMDGYVQAFKIYTYHLSFSIRFFQEALCLGIDKSGEGDDIHKLWGGRGPFSIGMIYWGDASMYAANPFGIEITPENYINDASEILVRSFNEYLLPCFERSDTIEKAYEEKCKQDDGKIYNYLSESCWMLQMGRWDDASEYLKKEIEIWKNYEKNNGYPIPEDFELEKLYNAICEKNDTFVWDYIHRKESITLKNLGFIREFNSRKK